MYASVKWRWWCYLPYWAVARVTWHCSLKSIAPCAWQEFNKQYLLLWCIVLPMNKYLLNDEWVSECGEQKSGTCECEVTWQKGIKVASGMRVADQLTSKKGEHPGSSRCAPCYHRVLKADEGGRRVRQRCKHGRSDWYDTSRTWPTIAGFEDGERGHEQRNVGSPWKLEKAWKWILP